MAYIRETIYYMYVYRLACTASTLKPDHACSVIIITYCSPLCTVLNSLQPHSHTIPN